MSFVILYCTVFIGYVSAQQGVNIQWKNGKAESIFVNKSLLKHYSDYPDSVSFFNVRVLNESTRIIGKTLGSPEGITFTPTWPFTPGMQYEIYWKEEVLKNFSIPAKTGNESIVKIYPGTDTLPENILKFYLLFSKPMREGNADKYVRVINERRDTLNVLLEMKPELWNDDNTMLTLWVDPGRIKRDLLLQQELGKPLIANNKYSLVVLPGWKDADGIPISTLLKKDFITLNPDRQKPDVNTWSVNKPKAKTTAPLTIHFKEPMDYAIAIRGLNVMLNENNIHGSILLTNDERVWTFKPDQPWKPGKYSIKIDPHIEDLAGNNLERLFDNDLEKNESALNLEQKNFTIDFEIK